MHRHSILVFSLLSSLVPTGAYHIPNLSFSSFWERFSNDFSGDAFADQIACGCGYTVNTSSSGHPYAIFTEIFETDFLHSPSLLPHYSSTGWRPQAYNVTPAEARGIFGKGFRLTNVVPNPLLNYWDYSGEAVHQGDAGLQLWVRAKHVDVEPYNSTFPGAVGLGVSSAEVSGDSRPDMMYGSFRVGMKMSGVNGTCGAFFWFRNNSQEIDMEFLSKEFTSSSGSVNLVLQTPQSVESGYNAQGTPGYALYPLKFNPSAGFHEYRFDWTQYRISFYVDGVWQYDMTENLPTGPGHIVLNHWSNGDPKWSGGPPLEDAVMTVSYVKAYFNSSDPRQQALFKKACKYPSLPGNTCQIPDQKVAPDPAGPDGNKTARTYFFTKDPGHAPFGIVISPASSLGSLAVSSGSLLLFVLGLNCLVETSRQLQLW